MNAGIWCKCLGFVLPHGTVVMWRSVQFIEFGIFNFYLFCKCQGASVLNVCSLLQNWLAKTAAIFSYNIYIFFFLYMIVSLIIFC